MAKELRHVDITHKLELLQIVEEAQSADQPLVLSKGGEDVAIVRPLRPLKKRIPRGRPTSADDPLWKLVGIGASKGPGDVSKNKHKYLADAYADLHK
ncbi:MAG: hypothetical protein M1358_05060 [Chloroflexi bacterium]|nr:hypothetical protein [Chloroflexota bacterium]